MEAHIIFMNDSAQCVVLTSLQEAQKRLLALKGRYYSEYKWMFKGPEDYNQSCYWHVKTIDCYP